jgi:hypothetical protein
VEGPCRADARGSIEPLHKRLDKGTGTEEASLQALKKIEQAVQEMGRTREEANAKAKEKPARAADKHKGPRGTATGRPRKSSNGGRDGPRPSRSG